MSKSWAPLSFFLLFLTAAMTVSCGSGGSSSGSNRQLQSIAIHEVSNGGDVSFTATGTYNAPPVTVTPLPASWYIQDPPARYLLTTQPFVVPCLSVAPGVTAVAPADPNAPTSGSFSSTKMIMATVPINCP